METILPNLFVLLSPDRIIQKLRSSFLFSKKRVKRFCVIFCLLLFFTNSVFADYTIASGNNITASTITGQSGVLTIHGTLTVAGNGLTDLTLNNSFTSVVIDGANAQILWTGNGDLKVAAGTTISIINSALGLQPVGDNSSKRLYVGTVYIAVSSGASTAIFSFAEFNGLGGMPEFNLNSNAPVCVGSAITVTVTPSRTSTFVFYYDWSVTAGSGGTVSPTTSSSTGSSSTSITPTITGTYTITCTIRDAAAGNIMATKTSDVVVKPYATITLSVPGTNIQSKAINTAITPIAYTIGGVGTTGATATGLPPGVTGSYNAGTFTISGSPTGGGTYNYTATTTGTNCAVSATGTITVSSNPEFKLNSGGYLKMSGGVYMVLKNTGFNNNGTLVADSSTFKFSGDHDTTTAYVKGNSTSTFYNLSSDKTAYGLVLKSPSKVKNVLSITASKLYTDSNLTLLSDANLTARVDIVPSGVSIIGKAMVERFMPGRRAWRLMTSPVTSSQTIFNTWQNGGVYEAGKGTWVTGPNPTGSGGNGLDLSPQNNISMKGFNFSTQAFTNVTNTISQISTGSNGSADNTGYFIFVRGDRIWENFNYPAGSCNTTTLTGIGALQTGAQTFNASTLNGKFTLIGNPYASPVNFNNISRTNVYRRFYFLDPTMGTTGTWVMLDDVDNGGNGDGNYTNYMPSSYMNQHIQSGQAFFVVTEGNVGSASLTFQETSKSGINNNNVLGRPMAPQKIASLSNILYIVNPDTAYIADAAVVEFDEAYSTNVNLQDASKIANTNENLGLYRNGVNICVERRPKLTVNDTLFFRLWKTTPRAYRFVFEPVELATTGLIGILEDNYLKTATPVSLSGKTIIDFTIDGNPASADNFRFRVVFKLAIEQGPLPVTFTNVNAYLQNNDIAVEWKVEHETDIVQYEIERSANGISFVTAGIKDAFASNANSNSYQWIDVDPVQGNNFYRIKSIDKTGAIKYTAVVKVMLGNVAGGINIYPNPISNGIANLQFDHQLKGTYLVKMTNKIGQLIYSDKIIHNSTSASYALKLSNAVLAAGIYQLEIIKPDKKRSIQNIIVE